MIFSLLSFLFEFLLCFLFFIRLDVVAPILMFLYCRINDVLDSVGSIFKFFSILYA
jgi:hypothetical protein